MNKFLFPALFSTATCLALAVPSVAMAQAAEPALASTVHGKAFELARHEETESATVTNVDQASRFVTLRDSKGAEFTIEAGPEVRNFAQLRAGDIVTVTYQAATALELLPANSGAMPSVETESDSARAPKGAKPGAEVGQSISITSRITALDLKTHTVTLTGPDGKQRKVEVTDPARQARMSQLKVGDLVRMTYVEGIAVQVTPKAKSKP
jgi:Cu/Ag efflux protein CusF